MSVTEPASNGQLGSDVVFREHDGAIVDVETSANVLAGKDYTSWRSLLPRTMSRVSTSRVLHKQLLPYKPADLSVKG